MLETLRRIVQEVSSMEDFRSALQILVTRVRETTHCDACSVFLVDEQQQKYMLTATEGLNVDCVGKLSLSLQSGLVGLVGTREEPINVEDAPSHPHFALIPEIGEERFRAFLGVPIIHHRQLYGVIIVQQEEQRRFDDDEVAFLVTISAQLGGVLAHAHASGKLAQIFDANAHSGTRLLQGQAAVPGISIGQVFRVYSLDIYHIPERTISDPEQEIILFQEALEHSIHEMQSLSKKTIDRFPMSEQALFDVYLKMLHDPEFIQEIETLIHQGLWAPAALAKVVKKHVREFELVEDLYLRERGEDILQLGQRILKHLQAQNSQQEIEYPDKTILVGEEITAADIAEVPEGKLQGIVCGRGSSSSHVAILARAMGIPTVMGVKGISQQNIEEQSLIVDGSQGYVWLSPSAKLLNQYQNIARQRRELETDLKQLRELPAETLDNHSILLLVNTGLGEDAAMTLSVGAQGIGLYRTEIPFMMRTRFPSEDEQYILYRQILKSLAPRPVIMRTLDVGGDKSLPYFPIFEDNPFLGWRGIRLTLDHPEVFSVQIRAMLRANEGLNNLRIMLPMVTQVSEVDEALRLLKKSHTELEEEGLKLSWPLIGAMIEVPAAVYQARAIASRVDFLSVGSNDLTQYILAVDRNNERVANMYDSLHPAVLQAIQATVEAAHAEKKKVSICGEMASDPLAVIALIGMDFDALSLNAMNIPRIKWLIRNISRQQSKEMLRTVSHFEDAQTIRKFFRNVLIEIGLERLVRFG